MREDARGTGPALLLTAFALITATGCAGPSGETGPTPSAQEGAPAASAADVVAAPMDPDDPLRPVRGIVEAVDNDAGVCVVSVGARDKVIRGFRFFVSRDGVDIATVTLDPVLGTCSAATINSMETPLRVGDHVRGPCWSGGWSNIGGYYRISDGSALGPTSPDWQVKGLVVAAEDSVCFLGVGTADTVAPGDEFTISRDGHFVAMATVEHVGRDVCLAVVQPGTGRMAALPGDEAWSEWRPVTDDEPIRNAK
jgi:hypothetical protein